jgi:hypothetical protein
MLVKRLNTVDSVTDAVMSLTTIVTGSTIALVKSTIEHFSALSACSGFM